MAALHLRSHEISCADGPQDFRHSPVSRSPLSNGAAAARGNPFGRQCARHRAHLGVSSRGAVLTAARYLGRGFGPGPFYSQALHHALDRKSYVNRAFRLPALRLRRDESVFHANSMGQKTWRLLAPRKTEFFRVIRA